MTNPTMDPSTAIPSRSSAFATHYFAEPDIERGLLAAISADETTAVYWKVLDHLPPGVFVEHEAEFKVISDAIVDGKPIPVFDFDPVEDPVAAAMKLADLYERRLAMDAMTNTLDQIRGTKAATEVLREHEAELTQIQQTLQNIRDGKLQPLPDLFPALLEKIREIYKQIKENGHTILGIETGFQSLDALLGGLQTGLHALAASPGMGKSTLALNFAVNSSKHGTPALFISFEEELGRLTLSALCCAAKLDKKSFWEGRDNPARLEQEIEKHGHKLGRLFLMQGSPRVSPSQVKIRAQQIMKRCQSNRILIVIDYLQFWASAINQSGDMRTGVVSLVSELKEIAMSLKSPILLISSQSKTNQGSASISSFKEAGEIEYTADTALLLVADQNRENVPFHMRAINLIVGKNRNGDIGTIKLNFEPAIARFEEVEA